MDYSIKNVCTDCLNSHKRANIESESPISAILLTTVTGVWSRIILYTVRLCHLCSTTTRFFAYGNALNADVTARVVSILASHALSEVIALTTDGGNSLRKGSISVSGKALARTGIDVLSDLKNIEDSISVSAEWRWNRRIGADFRYQLRHNDEKIDNTRDSKVNTLLTTLHVKGQQEDS